MRDDGHFEKWASAVLGVVCLFLVWHLARRFNGPRAVVPQQHVARSRSRRPPMVVSYRPHRDEIRDITPTTKPASPLSRAVHVSKVKHNLEVAKKPAPVRTQVATVHPDPAPAPPPAPAVAEFKTLGYVERPDGSVEAVVAEGSRVFLVHEGETFADRYRVLKVSASTVQAVDALAAQPVTRRVVPQETRMATLQDAPQPVSRRVAPSSAQRTPAPSSRENGGPAGSIPFPIQKALASPIKAAPVAVPNFDTQTAEGKMPGARTPNSGEHLGYVEMAGGTVKNIVAEGGEIRLVPQESVVAQRQEAANMPLLSVGMRPDILGNAPPIHRRAEGAVSTLTAARESIANKQLLPAVTGVIAAGTGPPGGLSDANSEEAIVPSGAGPPRPPVLRPGEWEKPKTSFAGTGVPDERAESVFPASIALKSVCYVEKADGSAEAVVASGNQAYLVHEGDIFADRYRVKKISPSTVEVEDEMVSSVIPPPSGRHEFAEGPTDWSQPLMAANHSPPELPSRTRVAMGVGEVSEFSGNGLETDGAGLSPPEVLAPQEPTSAISESSTSKREAIAGPKLEGPAAQSLSSEPEFAAVIEKAGARAGADVALRNPARKGDLLRLSGEQKLPGIAPLPLKISSQALQLPARLQTPALAVRPVGDSVLTLQAARAGRAPASSAGGNGNLSAEGFASISGASGTEAALASHVVGSGYDLLLQFSIGDNTCYPPR